MNTELLSLTVRASATNCFRSGIEVRKNEHAWIVECDLYHALLHFPHKTRAKLFSVWRMVNGSLPPNLHFSLRISMTGSRLFRNLLEVCANGKPASRRADEQSRDTR